MKLEKMIGRLQVEAWQQWSEWFTSGYNWRNFDVIALTYELEHYCEAHEVQVSLLGLCLRISYYYSKNFGKPAPEEPFCVDCWPEKCSCNPGPSQAG